MSTTTPLSAGPSTRAQLDELDALLQRMLALPLNQYDEPTAPVTPPIPAAPAAVPPPPVPRTPLPPDPMAGWTPAAPAIEYPSEPSLPPRMTAAARTPAAAPPVPPPPRRVDPIANLPGGSSVFAAWGVRDLTPEARQALVPQDMAPGGHPELGRPISQVPPASLEAVPVPPRPIEPMPVAAPVSMPDPFAAAGLSGFTVNRIEPPTPAPEPFMAPPVVERSPVVMPVPIPEEPTIPAPRPIAELNEAEADEPLGLLWWPAFALNWIVFGLLHWFGPPGRWLGSPAGRHTLGTVGVASALAAVTWGVIDWLGWQG